MNLVRPGAPRLVLASGSAARRRLLAAAGLVFEVVVRPVDEEAIRTAMRAQGADAAATARLLAESKARAVAAGLAGETLVVGGDQILDCEGEWLEKPGDPAALRTQLLRLRGRAHRLVTAAVLLRNGAPVWETVARARLVMRPFSDAFLERYLAVEGPRVLGCVGGYRLEGPGIQLFETVEGDPFAIQGLPLLPLLAALRREGVLVE